MGVNTMYDAAHMYITAEKAGCSTRLLTIQAIGDELVTCMSLTHKCMALHIHQAQNQMQCHLDPDA